VSLLVTALNTITVSNVSKSFGNLEVLKDVSFEIRDKEFVSIVGPSGCGKTTLLKIISGLISPDCGQVRIKGEAPELACAKRSIGFIFQNTHLLPWRNVKENIRLPLEIISKNPEKEEERIGKLLRFMGLEKFEKYYPGELSRGMRKRVSIARALSFEPEFLLMDEPFAPLDELLRERMNLELLRILRHERSMVSSIIFVTHSLREAVFLSDRVIVLSALPATMVKDMPIHLPKKRGIELRESEVVSHSVRRLRKLIMEDVLQRDSDMSGKGAG
jgi:NitT/TauT family transport system ATP-binding protein